MSYCRYCGTEIIFSKTVNDKWIPYDVSGNPHFCQEKNNKKIEVLRPCKLCGKPTFISNNNIIDYSTLTIHKCMKADITRYQKYLKKKKI